MQHKSIPIATLNSIYKIVWMDIVGKPPNYLPTISMSVLQMTKKKTAVQSMIAVFGQNITACEVWRFIRDNAWNALTSKDNAEYMSRVNAWHDISNIFDFTQSNSVEDNRYQNVRHRAEELLSDLASEQNVDNYNNQRVRLFVTTHKNVNRFESDIMHLCRLACTKAAIVSPGRSTMTKARISLTAIHAIAN